jgi:DNA-binding NarL/FixJ family response regulator
MNNTKIALVEDEALFRKSIAYMLQHEGQYDLVCECSNGKEIIAYLASGNKLPEIIVMDIKIPELDGVSTSKIIVKKYPDIKIVILTTYNTETFVDNILDMGAAAYISKNATPNEMMATINKVVERGFCFDGDMKKYLQKGLKADRLHVDTDYFTNRELEILKLICEQHNAKEISEKLFISPRTVDGHRNNLLEKTASKNIAGLVLFALKNGIYAIPE